MRAGGCGLKVLDYRDDILTEYRGYLKLKARHNLVFRELSAEKRARVGSRAFIFVGLISLLRDYEIVIDTPNKS